MLAKGDVALSVSLTALSSIITLFTIPVILDFSAVYIGNFPGHEIKLPVGNLVVQNLLMMLVPIVIGITMKRFFPTVAGKIHKILSEKSHFRHLYCLLPYFLYSTVKRLLQNSGNWDSASLC